jgi:hypothetical protein
MCLNMIDCASVEQTLSDTKSSTYLNCELFKEKAFHCISNKAVNLVIEFFVALFMNIIVESKFFQLLLTICSHQYNAQVLCSQKYPSHRGNQ